MKYSIEERAEMLSKDRSAIGRLLNDINDLDDLPLVSIGPSGIGGPWQKEYYANE